MIMIYYDLTMVKGLAEQFIYSQSLFQRAVEIGFRGPEDSIDDAIVQALLF